MIGVFLQSLLLGFSGAIVPGPLFAVTLKQALLYGWAAGLLLAVGHMIAELALLGVLRAGLGGMLRRPLVTRVIGIIGGMVLLYFAWGMIMVKLPHGSGHGVATTVAMSAGTLTLQGIILTLINPYWYLWWATAGVGLIGLQVEKHGHRAWTAFFVGHSLADYLWYVAVAVILAATRSFLHPGLYRGIIMVSGLGVACLGLSLLWRQLIEWRRSAGIFAPGIDKNPPRT